MTDDKLAAFLAGYLDRHRLEYIKDPDQDDIFVHWSICDAVEEAAGQTAFKYFRSTQFRILIAALSVGAEATFAPKEIPGLEQIVIVKGEPFTLITTRSIFNWQLGPEA